MALIRWLFWGCLLTGVVSFQQVSAQTFAEWFSQKKTQIKYLVTQIEALEQYGSYIRQGYQISQNGLGSIGNWARGEFDLHGAYYNSLRTVNPEIRQNPNANACIAYASAIAAIFSGLKGAGAELDEEAGVYVAAVSAKVLADTDADIAELELVMTDGKAGFTDDERLRRLDGIYTRLKDKYAFSRNFSDQVKSLVVQREQVLKDIETQRRVYEIN